MRIGIFGGTFDPIHIGHLRVAEEVAEKKKLDRILFVPTGIPPHRSIPLTSSQHRFKMVQMAVVDNPCFDVSDIEIRKKSKAYTIETLTKLKALFSQDKLYLILGADQCVMIHKWHKPQLLLENCQLIAMSRPGIGMDEIKESLYKINIEKMKKKIKLINVSKLDISSSEIRRRLHQQRSIRYLVSPAIQDYIQRNKLYL